MTVIQVNTLWENITIIEAQDQLRMLQVADWPNVKKGQRNKIHKELFSQAYPSDLRKKNYISIEDLGKVLGK